MAQRALLSWWPYSDVRLSELTWLHLLNLGPSWPQASPQGKAMKKGWLSHESKSEQDVPNSPRPSSLFSLFNSTFHPAGHQILGEPDLADVQHCARPGSYVTEEAGSLPWRSSERSHRNESLWATVACGHRCGALWKPEGEQGQSQGHTWAGSR